MRIGIYTPYLETLGGGERYMMTIAECLSQGENEVDVFCGEKRLKNDLTVRFDLNLEQVNFVKNIFDPSIPFWERIMATRKYGTIFFLSDGSIPLLMAKKNILHFQVPFTKVRGRSRFNQMKLKNISRVICNSKFTQSFVDQEYGFSDKSEVIYPPVAVEELKKLKKENLILSVGFFGQTLHSKRQDVLIDCFKKFYQKGFKNWRLLMVGGLKPENQKNYDKLKLLAKGLPVDFLPNLPFSELKTIYGKAKFFWHAAGFGVNEKESPERTEHFGMVVVEAMAAGCVPIVIKKGGIPEIVTNNRDGLLWETKDELVDSTCQLLKKDADWYRLSDQAIIKSRSFSKEVFCKRIKELIKN